MKETPLHTGVRLLREYIAGTGLCTAIALLSLLAMACAPGHGGLSERELAAARDWKPTRWAEGNGTALIVMDMQKANMPIFDQERVVAAILRLVGAADMAGSPVVWVYSNDDDSRPGEDQFELTSPFAPGPGHLKLVKVGTSALSGTNLGSMLEERGVGRLVICGVSSNECVKTTVDSSYFDGWLTVVAKDAHSVPVREGSAEPVAKMNARWAADKRVQLLKSAAISFN
ncbi:MAG: hypothetical protein CVV51_06935 [Spirochaetae bacterium HGW-Spirochaetae-7]|jgi:nicotinamidase-related amidase|nr:MAG: hypothetical protein CVV51_06935 [Spirochaetae bacterium HGW-Spirochaetae-7]